MKKFLFLLTILTASCGVPKATPVEQYDLGTFSESGTVFGARLVQSNCILGQSSSQTNEFRQTSGGEVVSTLLGKGVDILFSSVSRALASAAEGSEQQFKDGISLVTGQPGPNDDDLPSCLHFAVGEFSVSNTSATLASADATKQRILQSSSISANDRLRVSQANFRSGFSTSELWLAKPPQLFVELNLKYTRIGEEYFVSVSPTIVMYDQVIGTSRLGESTGQRDLLFTLKIESLKPDGKSEAGPTIVLGFDSVDAGTVLVPGTAKSFESDWKYLKVWDNKVVRNFEVDFVETRDASAAVQALAELFASVEDELKTEVATALDPNLQAAEANAAAQARADQELQTAQNSAMLFQKKTEADQAIAAAAANVADKTLAFTAWSKAAETNQFAVSNGLVPPFSDETIASLRAATEQN